MVIFFVSTVFGEMYPVGRMDCQHVAALVENGEWMTYQYRTVRDLMLCGF